MRMGATGLHIHRPRPGFSLYGETARAAASGNTSVEAVGAINGTKDDRG